MIAKQIKRTAIAILLGSSFLSNPIANAEIQTYEGVGEHYMADETETLEAARNQAKLIAERSVLEQIQMYIASYSDVHNSELTRDETIAISAGIMNIKHVSYSITQDSDDTFIVQSSVTADVDTDQIPKLIEREVRKRV